MLEMIKDLFKQKRKIKTARVILDEAICKRLIELEQRVRKLENDRNDKA